MNRNKQRTYYHTCPACGANLDPGEQCDCETAHAANSHEEAAA